jgi:hypothetical protein
MERSGIELAHGETVEGLHYDTSSEMEQSGIELAHGKSVEGDYP